jgi:hypothetical protein
MITILIFAGKLSRLLPAPCTRNAVGWLALACTVAASVALIAGITSPFGEALMSWWLD